MTAEQVVRPAGAGDAVWMLGGRYTVKVSGADSDGQVTVMEMAMPAGFGPPPHTHPGGESVYVLDGTARFNIGDEVVEAGPGSFLHIPAGTVENFEPTSDLRLLVAYTPGGIDKFFLELGDRAEGPGLPPTPQGPPSEEFMNRMVTVAARYGMDMKLPASH
ncbi:cupin domain-containing protein [Nocardia nepalensis]|uniref:cupin domain-containing protein n=1 Tax=Nocardia nepalensis TaxID=3375448 RepID=UPI003B6738F3